MKTAILLAFAFLSAGTALGAAPATGPATRPTPAAVARATALAANIKSFQLHLNYAGDQDKPYYHLHLSTVPVPVAGANPFHRTVTVTHAEAAKVIDRLLADGFLDRAVDAEIKKLPPPPSPCYTLRVTYDDETGRRRELYEVLGWGKPLLPRLDGLRAVLEGDAAKSMDFLLGRLSGHRREWEAP